MNQHPETRFTVSVSRRGIRCEVTGGPDEATVLRIVHTGRQLLGDIVLGMRIDGRELGFDSELVATTSAAISESYEMRTGKRAGLHSFLHDERTLTLRDRQSGELWGVSVRAADDGAAFRYCLPDERRSATVGNELTAIPVPPGSRSWPLLYQTWYETPRFGADVADLVAAEYGFPFLLRAGGDHVLISEAAIDGRFSGSHATFTRDGDRGVLTVTQANASVELAGGTALPWRAVIIGAASDVVASSLIDDLAPPADASLAAAPWIRPGHAAWSWWSDTNSPADLTTQQRYVEYAAARGWEHVLVDAGWNTEWVPALVEFAKAHGVGIFLWSHWVELQEPEAARKLGLWKSWGIVGVKVDFMESESQERYRWYDFIIAETAKLQLMVNFHGSVIPRGWARTYPHVVSYEGIRGAEYYIIDQPSPTASHNVIQPFTRNVVGSMDYTPVTFSAVGRETSDGHELGLAVAFECGITHFADAIDEYARRTEAEAFLTGLPPLWHETRLVSGTPDTEAVVARRHDDAWYVGCIATGPARTIELDLDALMPGPCDVRIVGDALPQPGLVETWHRRSRGKIHIDVAENGGFAGIIHPATD